MTALKGFVDQDALRRNRRRSERSPEPALFLHEVALDELRERIADVNRDFPRKGIVTGHKEFWKAAFPDAETREEGELLGFARGEFDLILHAMSLHWANDPVGQLVQARLALCPDGLFLAVAFGEDTLLELRAALTEAELNTRGGASPRVVPMAGVRDFGGLLQRAGLALAVTDKVRIQATYGSLTRLMQEIRAMGESNAMLDRCRTATPRCLFDEAGRIYAERFSGSGGRLVATFDLVFLAGWAPSPSQQRPLRPGSATARLSDALSTTETRMAK